MKIKKSQGLTLNTIIIAALVLIVLVILVLIFTGRMGITRQQVDDCVNNGGVCQQECTGTYSRQVVYECDNDGDGTTNEGSTIDGVCCLTV